MDSYNQGEILDAVLHNLAFELRKTIQKAFDRLADSGIDDSHLLLRKSEMAAGINAFTQSFVAFWINTQLTLVKDYPERDLATFDSDTKSVLPNARVEINFLFFLDGQSGGDDERLTSFYYRL